jgi:flagellar basal-body rod modification protein FlgD
MSLDFSAITAASATPVTPTTSSTSTDTSSATATDDSVGSQDYFLKLLVAQMNNQDPLNPMDSSQMTSQLAQLNTVQGIQKLSTQLDSLLGDVGTSQSLQASSLVGHDVLVPGSTLDLASGEAAAGFNLSADADDVKVDIKDSSGKVIHTADLGKQSAGIANFVWDGSTDSGAAAANGAYTFSVTATADGTAVAADTLSIGAVSSVTPGSGGASVFVNGIGTIAMTQVKQIY